jgi:PAS domain S-box-containing protein
MTDAGTHTGGDNTELRRCFRDLVKLSILSGSWINYAPRQIVDAVAGTLLSMLGCDLVFVILSPTSDEREIQVIRKRRGVDAHSAGLIRATLAEWLSTRLSSEAATQVAFHKGLVRIFSVPVGVQAGGALVAGSLRSNFPSEAERLLLRGTASEIATGLIRCRAQSDERRFAAMLQHSSDFICFATLDGTPFYLNAAGRKLVGLDEAADLRHLHFLDFVVLEERAWIREKIWPLAMRQGRWVGEIRFRNFKTGAEIPTLNEWFLVDGAQAWQPMHMATISRDLSARKRWERELSDLNETLEHHVAERTQELASANRNLSDEKKERERSDARLQELQSELYHAGRLSVAGQMAAALAHELSQPLTAIANSLGAGRRLTAVDPVDVRTLREVIDEATSQVVRAGQIMRRLRAFVSHSEASKGIESIAAMIEDASALALANAEALGLEVRFSFDPGAPHAFADRIQIQLVITNLLRNALDAMAHSERRELAISTALIDEATIDIAVADSGSGLSAEVADHLFEPFISTKDNGMGLGLSLCRLIIEGHGGALRCEPNSGGGTIFRFTLPAAPAVRLADGE